MNTNGTCDDVVIFGGASTFGQISDAQCLRCRSIEKNANTDHCNEKASTLQTIEIHFNFEIVIVVQPECRERVCVHNP